MASEKTVRENINIIKDEFLKLNASDAASATMDNIEAELKRLREKHQ